MIVVDDISLCRRPLLSLCVLFCMMEVVILTCKVWLNLNCIYDILQQIHADVIFSLPSKDDFFIKSVSVKPFTLEFLELATERYKTLIGEGGFGSVYRGTLDDGQEVAVKVRSATSTQGTREFDNEVYNILCMINLLNVSKFPQDVPNLKLGRFNKWLRKCKLFIEKCWI